MSAGKSTRASSTELPAGLTWERIADLFTRALEVPAEGREDFLSATCGGEPALAAEVRSLLRSHQSASKFLEPSTTPGTPLTPSLLASIGQASLFEQFAPGALIGNRYRVNSLLGRGGAGEVFEAWDEELSIPVALKALRFASIRGLDALRSLKQEAMLARSVVHSNVCRVYDLGCHGDPTDGAWFLTMEVLRGDTLADRLRGRSRFTPEEAWPLVEQLAAGLEAAHQSGIVHLDFKSANVMLVGESGREQAVITDFGLARAVRQGGDDLSVDGSDIAAIVGTPAYMAPEQVRGEVAGPAADIYALGIVLYEMITGNLPFTGGTEIEVAERRLEAEAPSPRSILPELDERWEAVIRRCLERDPRRRFARASDVADALAGRLSMQANAAESTVQIQHSLPIEQDRFVGREAELGAVERAIASGGRLVTLLGSGGMGKTRLALRYGWRSLESWPGGVWFCDLTEARDVNGIASAVARSLGVPLGKEDPLAQLGDMLVERGQCLVVLDNMEQVRDQGAVTVQRWVDRTNEAQFLVTSREPLGIPGESVLDIEPMGLESGIELFNERAKRLRPGLDLHGAEKAAAREVVRLLEGIPLAIELAAARMRVMSAAQLVVGMQKRFSLLTGGRSERHETLAAAIDGSWDLLRPWEKAAFAQCSVFEGGFTLAAAESVLDLSAWSAAPWPVDVVQSLLDKSLLRTWVPERKPALGLPTPRFGMFVSLQEYARRKLKEEGSIPEGRSGARAVLTAEERHGRWYGAFGTDQAVAALGGDGGTEERRELGNDLENLMAASRRAAARGEGGTATAAYRAAWEVISYRGPHGTAVELGATLLAVPLAHQDRAMALTILAHAEKDSGRLPEALGHFEAVLAIHRELGDRRSEGNALANLGTLHRLQGRMDEARDHYEAALSIHREVGDRRSEATLLSNLGGIAQEQILPEDAWSHYEAALAIHREIGDRRWEGVILGNMANMLMQQPAQWENARRWYEAALAIYREVGDRRTEGIFLGNLGTLAFYQNRKEEAKGHWENAFAIHREVGNRRSEGITLSRLAHLHLEEGRVEEARVQFEAALAIHQNTGDQRWEGIVLANLGGLYLKQGRMADAESALTRGETLLRASKAQTDLPKALCIRAELEHRLGNLERAQALLDEIEVLAARAGSDPESELGRMLAKLRQTLA